MNGTGQTSELSIGVFGANGFIGRAVVRHLVALGRPVIAFGRFFPPDYAAAVGGEVETRLIDFNDPAAAFALIQDVTSVVQLINSSSPAVGNSRAVFDINANVVPHVAFIESCMLAGVSKFLFLSSGGTVYGEPLYLPMDEEHPTRPINSYGMTKLTVEHYLRLLTRESDMAAISLRVSNPFGPGQVLKKGQGLIAAVLRSHSAGQPIRVFGNGSVQRDYVYIDDVADAVVRALDSGPMRGVLNIGSGVGRSVLDVIEAIRPMLVGRTSIDFAPGRATDATANVLNCDKAAELLGWRASTPFEEALRHTVESWG